MNLSINQWVKYKLSPVGEEALKRARPHHKPDDDGWYRLQLWQWIQTYGPEISLGESPFTQIVINDPSCQPGTKGE